MCFKRTLQSLPKICANTMSVISELMLLLLGHLKKLTVETSNVIFAYLATNRSGPVLLELFLQRNVLSEEKIIYVASFTRMLEEFFSIHATSWRANAQRWAQSLTFSIPQMQMQKISISPADPLALISVFFKLKLPKGISIELTKQLISELLVPCLTAFTPIDIEDTPHIERFVLALRGAGPTDSYALFQICRLTLLGCTRAAALSLLHHLAPISPECAGLGLDNYHSFIGLHLLRTAEQNMLLSRSSLRGAELNMLMPLQSLRASESNTSIPTLHGWRESLANIYNATISEPDFPTLGSFCKPSSINSRKRQILQELPPSKIPRFSPILEISRKQNPRQCIEKPVGIFNLHEIARQAIWAAVLSSRCSGQSISSSPSLQELLSSLPLPPLILQYLLFD